MNRKGGLLGYIADLGTYAKLSAQLKVQGAMAAVEKAATTFTPENTFLGGGPVAGGPGSASGADAYSNSWVAYACIRRLAQDASGIRLVVLKDPNDPESIVPDSHPVVRMLADPNQLFNTGQFIQSLVTLLNLRGEFFITFDDPNSPTKMFQYYEPIHWHPIKDSEGTGLVGWEYRSGRDHEQVALMDLIQHRLIDPDDPLRGQAPLRAAAVAYNIDLGADRLQRDVIARGGERSILYRTKVDTTQAHRDQALDQLRARRSSHSAVAKDVILPNGIDVVDPKFIEDDLKILESQKMQPDKICAVYGVPKSLLGFEDIDKFATFTGRVKMYFASTLIPMLRGIEATFDNHFNNRMRSPYHGYVRFDLSSVPALQDDSKELFAVAGAAHRDGLPWDVLNERFSLGLDVSKIPGSDTVMVPSTMAPLDRLVVEWSGAPDKKQGSGSEPPVFDRTKLTNELIRLRAFNPRTIVQRRLRLLRMEKELRTEWKAAVTETMNAVQKGLATAADEDAAVRAVNQGFKGHTEKTLKLVQGYYPGAVAEGVASIMELVDGKMSDAAWAVLRKGIKWRSDVTQAINDRDNFIKGMGRELYDEVKETARKAVVEGGSKSTVYALVQDRFIKAPGGIARALTIARNEVGAAYNVARYSEMKGQKFSKHEWFTTGDGAVRTTHTEAEMARGIKIGELFPGVGLAYPMQAGGEPEEVINCRCTTVPVVE